MNVNAVAREALDAARGGDRSKATELLGTLRGTDPKPALYWYAWAEVRRAEGNDELLATSLFAFSANLFGKHMEVLGFNGPGPVAADALRTLNPAHLSGKAVDADRLLKDGRYAEAIPLFREIIDGRIALLRDGGYDVFAAGDSGAARG